MKLRLWCYRCRCFALCCPGRRHHLEFAGRYAGHFRQAMAHDLSPDLKARLKAQWDSHADEAGP